MPDVKRAGALSLDGEGVDENAFGSVCPLVCPATEGVVEAKDAEVNGDGGIGTLFFRL